ncbi:hydrogenase-4 component A [Methanobrevibacter cuticularis]|uniref:Hydrogenase-4 component A n=1 Tax=Methanobrevibacter cuticularis TaxID=47311 RepID=A0A166DDB8_9EURY|nr:4Fe-4S dicluster domain-containing protein [Methanobrevibacter cuticularis]KZX15469.1 hydrogenase-4 component A [Methanobrevibacter cuticularis]
MKKITIQSDLCDGCLDCEQACCGLYGTSRITIREVEGSYYPIICQQCENAPCVIICPTDAMSSNGINQEKCIACGLCMMVCPFGAVKVENREAQKCDRCESRGESPACIKACSKRAIALIDTDELKSMKQDQFLSKMAGIKNKPKKNNFINILTSSTRSNRSYKDKKNSN